MNITKTATPIFRTLANKFRTVTGETEEEYLDLPEQNSGEAVWDRLVAEYGDKTIEDAMETTDPMQQLAYAYHPDLDVQYAFAMNEHVKSNNVFRILITSKSDLVRAAAIQNPNLDPGLLAARLDLIGTETDEGEADYFSAIERCLSRVRANLPLEQEVVDVIEGEGYNLAAEIEDEGYDYESIKRI